MVNTKPPKTSMTTQTTMAHTITSQKAMSSSVVWNRARGGLSGFNFFLQYRCNKVFGAILRKQAVRFLATLRGEVRRILTVVAVAILTSAKHGNCKSCHDENENKLHSLSFLAFSASFSLSSLSSFCILRISALISAFVSAFIRR